MQTSIIKDALSSPDSLRLFWKGIAVEVQEYERKASKKGSVCHIVLDEDMEFVLEKEHVLRLLQGFLDDELPAAALNYIGNAFMLAEWIDFADDDVCELVPNFIDPEVNGAFTREKATALIRQYESGQD